MKEKAIKQGCAGMMIWILLIVAFLPYLPPMNRSYGAVSFGNGEICYPEELVALWDGLAAQEGMDLERTDFVGHMTKTYPHPGIVVYKQQTSVSPSGRWKDYEYRNMYCISHSRELAENPDTTMETTAVWYIKKEPYTLQNLPEFIRIHRADEELVRLNFLIMAYAANYEAYQGTVNSDPVIGTADYYLCQSFCTLSEEGKFTGNYQQDLEMYRQHATQIARRYHPSELGSSKVYEDMMARMDRVFQVVWNTARLTAACRESSDSGYLFHPVITQEADGMYHTSYPLTEETREIISAAIIAPYGDWSYEIGETGLNFKSPTGQMPEGGVIAQIDLESANGIIRKSLGQESVRELHMPVKLGGSWSLTFAQGNLVSNLKEGLKILVGNPETGENPPAAPSGFSSVRRYRHHEQWQADYVVNLRKLDGETGKPLEGAWFDILEAFDEGQLEGSILEDDNWDNDLGSQFLRWEGWDSPYGSSSPDPCQKDQEVTGADGWLRESYSLGVGELLPSENSGHRDIKYYSYTKGYCGGHPEPEDEEDEEAWEEYERQMEICERLVSAGGFYHSLSGGARESLRQDRDRHYREFVSLTYVYSARELAARKGYICHNQERIHEPFENIFDGIHPDTVPVETVTVHSSQYYDLAGREDGKGGARNAGSEKERMTEEGQAGGREVAAKEGKEKKELSSGQETILAEEKAILEEISGEETFFLTDQEPLQEKGEAALEKKSLVPEKYPKASASNSTADEQENPGYSLATKSNGEAVKKTEVLPGEVVNLEDVWILDEDERLEEMWEEASPADVRVPLQIFPGMVRRARELAEGAAGAVGRTATPSNGKVLVAGGKGDSRERGKNFSIKAETIRGTVGFLISQISLLAPGDEDYSGKAGSDWNFELYDHRTEGEVHINKRDLLLKKGENEHYDSYGDIQGDGTLEGAVYGLFAAVDLEHPDGVTGVVFEKDNLVAVATTDKNGDASFLVITEAPGSVYDYSQGKITATGFSGPGNLYHQDFRQHTSNPDSHGGESWSYPIADNQSANGNCWIGRPLLLGSYYLRELTRSEGYELSVYGLEAEISNRSSWLAGGSTEARGEVRVQKVLGVPRYQEDTGKEETVTEIDLQTEGVEYGLELSVKNIHPDSQPGFYLTNQGRKEVYREWKEPEIYYERVEAVPGTLVMIEGKAVEAKMGERILLPSGDTGIVNQVKTVAVTPEKNRLTGERGGIVTLDTQYIPELRGISGQDKEDFVDSSNNALAAIGLEDPGEEAPYFRIPLGENSSQWVRRLYEFLAAEDGPAFNGARLETVTKEKGGFYGILRYSFLENGEALPVVYSATNQSFYVKHAIRYGEGTEGYLYQEIPLSQLDEEDYEKGKTRYRWIRVPNEKPEKEMAEPYEDLNELSYVNAQQWKTFWAYGEGEQMRGEEGEIYQKECTRYVDRFGYQTVETLSYEPLEAEYNPTTKVWKIPVAKTQLPEKGELRITIRYKNRFAGESQSLTVAAAPSMNLTGTYIKGVELVYPGQQQAWEDGGTRQDPIQVLERGILQRVRVMKDIDVSSYHNRNSYGKVHEDWFTRLLGGFLKGGEAEACAKRLDNFRFKIYLKSNLARLYRNEEGMVIWQDRKGRDLSLEEVYQEKVRFPELVRKIYTKVSHQRDPLFQDSREAVTANEALYGYREGRINENPNPGYTAILETRKKQEEESKDWQDKNYNYEKFFQAVNVANRDKWDDKAPSYTSWQPIGNISNRREETLWNARVSDEVRQFAIDWYLEDELAKQMIPTGKGTKERQAAEGRVAYPDEILDRATWAAIQKAENYLKPFFAYDFDEIYAVDWEEETGGRDGDRTTLSADQFLEEGYCGTSAYLPYGTYVVVEQQPRYAGSEYEWNLKDFKNKHYETDKLREISLPSVYEGEEGAQAWPEKKNTYYVYDSEMTGQEQEKRYRIRFRQEDSVIQARNHCGDFEIFKYGMEIEKITNGVPEIPGRGDYFALTQEEYKPDKNHYNAQDNPKKEGVTYYLTEGQSGQKGIGEHYRYSSVSEQEKETKAAMHGVQTAYEGEYASMLVPWGVTAALGSGSGYSESGGKEETTGESTYQGFVYGKFSNPFFGVKLRLEKLDSETHENILHDNAIFAIYAAKREDREEGNGRVCFYEKAATISGSREFLDSMGAEDIRPVARNLSFWDKLLGKEQGPGNLFTGRVPAGTPICEESERVVLTDERGIQRGEFASYSTVLDERMRTEETDSGLAWQLQTTGYLETPQPLGAGAYVICEEKAPAGYARSKPIAIEVYSDKITYYKEGNRDSRVVAAVYEGAGEESEAEGGNRQEREKTARVNVENIPIKLTVEKQKESSAHRANTTEDKTVTYKVSGRIEGKLTDIGNHPDYSYAYEGGRYLGYGWRKGTLEYLTARKQAGEQVQIAYEGAQFAGYGYVTRKLGTAKDENPYVAGATMALFDALMLEPSGDTQDHSFEGLVIERNGTSNIIRMYVKEGYAGERTELIWDSEQKQWRATALQRKDTDILYYDLDSLEVITSEIIDGRRITFGYDRNHNKIPVAMVESDKANFHRTDTEHSLFAFQGGIPYLEFVGGDFTKLSYSPVNKVLTVGEGTRVYHLNREGNRDSLVDPYTGMAYVPVQGDLEGRVMVWPVRVHRDEYGNVIARDKITTFRPATLEENQDGYQEEETLEVVNHSGNEIPKDFRPSYQHRESGSITGTWSSEKGEESHQKTTHPENRLGQNLNGEILRDDNNGSFSGELNPVYDDRGLPRYYQRSGETYDKGTELYDRNGDFVRYQDSDHLEGYNNNAYHINSQQQLRDGEEEKEIQSQKKLYHRQGEGYILENIWVTSDKTPNDPFRTRETEGQPDILKRVPAGNYIMEELESPVGYVTGLPVGVAIRESSHMQNTGMLDSTIKVELSKIDAPLKRRQRIWEVGAEGSLREQGAMIERTGGYTYGLVPGAELTLFAAKRVYSPEEPGGYYLEKISEEPFVYESTNSRTGKREWVRAQWITGTEPIYLEGIPAGYYLLEETGTPEGFITGEPVKVVIQQIPEVQIFSLCNDHTKIEIEKYTGQGKKKKLLAGAKFALYRGMRDDKGDMIFQEGSPKYDPAGLIDQWVSSDRESYRGFITAFEAMYRDYGAAGASVKWKEGEKEYTARCVTSEVMDASWEGGHGVIHPEVAMLIWETEEGEKIRIMAYGEDSFEYQFDYHLLPEINSYACAYTSLDGVRRFDYLPAGEDFVLVETEAPAGYAKPAAQRIQAGNTEEIRRYAVENTEGKLYISKVSEKGKGELAGARLRLYRAGAKGEFIPEEKYLEAKWITGEDGVYTDEDFVNGEIPKGYHIGERRLHEISGLENGHYWLSEIESPDYYRIFHPVPIEYKQGDEIRTVRVWDTPVSGSLEIEKKDNEGKSLKGAVFELTAYRQGDQTNPVLTQSLKNTQGKLRVEGLPVGAVKEDGSIEPYLYKLREIAPPKGYAVTNQIFTWRFEPNRDGASFLPEETAEKMLEIVNEPTRIFIGKKELDSLGIPQDTGLLTGAELAIYEITGKDGEGKPIYAEKNPVDQWCTDGTEHKIEGLIAGYSYLLKELSAPKGYEEMKPVIFTLSQDGRGIAELGGDFYGVVLPTGGEGGSGVTVKGRYPVRTEYELWKNSHEKIASWSGSRAGQVLSRKEFPQAEGICTLKEKVYYNDGSFIVSSQRTEKIGFDVKGLCRIPGRKAERTCLEIEDHKGREIHTFFVNEAIQEKRIPNRLLWGGTRGIGKGRSYVLTEYTEYSDGSRLKSGAAGFVLNEQGTATGILAADPKTRVCLSKKGITGSKELPGCRMRVKDCYGKELISWVSGEEPYMLEGVLIPGESYYLEETYPENGYAWGEEICFTLFPEGITNTVVMRNEQTRVRILKIDQDTRKPLSGARLQIWDQEGKILEEWISGEECHEITGRLKAGEWYYLREKEAPEGYRRSEEIRFWMPQKAEILELTFENRKEENPPKPEEPKKPERPGSPKGSGNSGKPEGPGAPKDPGRISAVYSPKLPKADGSFLEILPDPVPKLALAGDQGGSKKYWIWLLVSFLGMIFTFSAIFMTKQGRFAIIDRIRKARRKNRERKN